MEKNYEGKQEMVENVSEKRPHSILVGIDPIARYHPTLLGHTPLKEPREFCQGKGKSTLSLTTNRNLCFPPILCDAAAGLCGLWALLLPLLFPFFLDIFTERLC